MKVNPPPPKTKFGKFYLDQRVIVTTSKMPILVKCYNCGFDGLTRIELMNGNCSTKACIICCALGLIPCAPFVYCMDCVKDAHH